MDKITIIAEKILSYAARSNDGNCYPAQIIDSKNLVEKALGLLEMYGKTYPFAKGANPIFVINDKGKEFAIQGAWTGESFREELAAKRYDETIALAKKNNRYVVYGIIVTLFIGIISILVTILLHKNVI